jgi:hypothetical protein
LWVVAPCVSYYQRPTMRGRAPWTRLRLMRDMKSRRRTTLLNGLSVPTPLVRFLPSLSRCVFDMLTASQESVEFDEELEVDIVAKRNR